MWKQAVKKNRDKQIIIVLGGDVSSCWGFIPIGCLKLQSHYLSTDWLSHWPYQRLWLGPDLCLPSDWFSIGLQWLQTLFQFYFNHAKWDSLLFSLSLSLYLSLPLSLYHSLFLSLSVSPSLCWPILSLMMTAWSPSFPLVDFTNCCSVLPQTWPLCSMFDSVELPPVPLWSDLLGVWTRVVYYFSLGSRRTKRFFCRGVNLLAPRCWAVVLRYWLYSPCGFWDIFLWHGLVWRPNGSSDTLQETLVSHILRIPPDVFFFFSFLVGGRL